jgi:hypothetical protein
VRSLPVPHLRFAEERQEGRTLARTESREGSESAEDSYSTRRHDAPGASLGSQHSPRGEPSGSEGSDANPKEGQPSQGRKGLVSETRSPGQRSCFGTDPGQGLIHGGNAEKEPFVSL